MIEFGKGKLTGIDLTNPRTHAEVALRDVWSYIRKTQPILWHPVNNTGFWVVSRYSDIRNIILDKDNFTSRNGSSIDTLLSGGDPAGGTMLSLSDGSRHLAVRAQLQKFLRPSVMNGLSSRLQRNARERLARVLNTKCDFAGAFAKDFPLDTICDLLGVEKHEDRDKLHSFSSNALSSQKSNATPEESNLARNEILMFFAELIENRRTCPGDDLISDLIRMEESPLSITYEEAVYDCYNLLLGGNEEPRFAILGMMKALAENPAEWCRLKKGEVSIASAVEEILRWTSPVLHLARTVVNDVLVNDTTLRAGQIVSLWISSANFDEEVFEEPHRLSLGRKNNAHLSFGFGAHYCIGANLARMELSAVAEALVKNVETIQLTGDPKPIYSNFMSGFASLPLQVLGDTSAATSRQRNKCELAACLNDVSFDFFCRETQSLAQIKRAVQKFAPYVWFESNKQLIEEVLCQYGGIVFRDFGINSIADFNKAVHLLVPTLQDYVYRSSPRTKLGGKVYTATEYPCERSIPLHNENSYTDSWPSKIFFYSAIVATHGGETIVADSRRVYRAIDVAIRAKFEKKGVLYVRNYTPGVDLSWQEVFQTDDQEAVNFFCQQHQIEIEWRTGTPELTTRQKCQATLRHPKTGELVWFNQAHLFHFSALERFEQECLINELGLENVPRNSFYGDGEPIEPDVLAHIREVLDHETITFQWQRGDLMVLDNVLFAHGRNPFSGPRKIAVAMG
jgi:cytochrome P450/alpha-ketoglutarate-dependent taurine dioxygenase